MAQWGCRSVVLGGGILVVAVCWCVGIALAGLLQVPGIIAALAAVAAICAAGVTPSSRVRLLALGMAALLLGQTRLALDGGTAGGDELAAYAGDVIVRGRVIDAPIPRGRRVEAVVAVDAVSESGRPRLFVPLSDPRPQILLRAAAVDGSYGDAVEVRGHLAKPRSRPGWPLAEMLARRGVYWTLDAGYVRVIEAGGPSLSGWLAAARLYAEETTRGVLPEPHASLLSGMVFGARAGLPPDLRAALTTTGTSHLTAVSGANVALVAGSLIVVAVRLVGRGSASLLAIVGVWLYTLLVGAPPSALRAATMATFALVAHGLGRQADAIVGLSVAAALLLGWNPGLAFDLGFQLSVAATAGLILLSPAIEHWLGWLPNPARGWVAIAVAAQLATLPIVVGTFQRISLISLPANVLAAPTVSAIMGIGAALAVLGRLPGLDVLLGWAAWGLTSLLLLVIEGCASVPGAMVAVGRAPAWLPLAWYGVLGCWVAAGSADVRALGVGRGTLVAGTLASICLVPLGMLGGWVQADRSGVPVVSLLDVEPSAAFVRDRDGRTALILTAEPGPGLLASVSGQLALWEGSVDLVIGPGGMRTGVDLLALAGPAAPEVGEPPYDVSDASADLPGRAMLQAGSRIDLSGVTLLIVDVRQADERPVLDLAVQADGVAMLVPGPGTPSLHWPDVASDLPTIARLPSSAVTWARGLPPRAWLLLVGEPALGRARGESGVPFLSQREYGLIEVTVREGTARVRTERCAAGLNCDLELPPPGVVRLLPSSE